MAPSLRIPLLLSALCWAEPAWAQQYQYVPVAGSQYALAITALQKLTVPAQARIAEICVETASARYTTSGTTPTGATGIPVASGGCFQLAGGDALRAFQIIGAGATVDVEYFQ